MPGANSTDDDTSSFGAALSQAGKVLGLFGQLGQAIGVVSSLVSFIEGAKSSTQLLLDAIGQLTDAVEQGMANLVNAINGLDADENWSSYRKARQDWKNTLDAIALVFGSLDKDTQKVAVQTGTIAFVDWVESAQPLQQLAGIVEAVHEQLTASSDAGDPNMLDTWNALVVAKQAAGVAGFAGETHHSLLHYQLQSLYLAVSRATALHSAILAVYWRSPGTQQQFVNLAGDLTALGDVTQPNSAWGRLGTAFESLETHTASIPGLDPAKVRPVPYLDDQPDCSLAGFANATPGNDLNATLTSDINNLGERIAFWAGPTVAPPGGYFTKLELIFVAMQDAGWRMWFLKGLAEFLPDARSPDSPALPPQWLSSAPLDRTPAAGEAFMQSNDTPKAGRQDVLSVAVGYGKPVGPPPPPGAHDAQLVVTGFQIVQFGACIALGLQYGYIVTWQPGGPQELAPMSGFFSGPNDMTEVSQIFKIGQDVDTGDMNVAGCESGYPLTNASFIQNGARIAVVARTAPQTYRLSTLQPNSLIASLPQKPAPQPQPKLAPQAVKTPAAKPQVLPKPPRAR